MSAKKKKKKRVGLTVVIIALVLVAAAGAWLVFKDKIGGDETVVYVQPVSEVAQYAGAGARQRYAGVVEAKDTVTVDPESGMNVKECYVAAGDTVTEGMPLFSYDVEELTLSYEQLLIDIMGLENTIESDTKQIERLDKKIAKAKESAIYELELKRSEVNLELKKSEFTLVEKRAKAETTKKAIDNAVVYSPCAGRVKSVKSDNSASDVSAYLGGSSSDDAYITIISGNTLWVKCSVSEQTVRSLTVGTRMVVRSRLDETDVRLGTVERIDTDTTVSSGNNYYASDSGDSAGKYPFYVTPDTSEELMLGQHLYVEIGDSLEEKTGLWLPASYVVSEDGGSFVYAVNSLGRIEKRTVTVGGTDGETETVQIASGLKKTDSIAYPEDARLGAKAETVSYADDDYDYDYDYDYGEDDEEYDADGIYGDEEAEAASESHTEVA